MLVPCARSALIFVRWIELLVLRVGNEVPRHIEAGQGDFRQRTLGRACAGRIASHDEFAGWNEKHLLANRVDVVGKPLAIVDDRRGSGRGGRSVTISRLTNNGYPWRDDRVLIPHLVGF